MRRCAAVLLSAVLAASMLTMGAAESAAAAARTTPFQLLMQLTVAPETKTHGTDLDGGVDEGEPGQVP